MFNWALICLSILIQVCHCQLTSATQGSIVYTSYPTYTSSVDLRNADFSGLYATNTPTTTNAVIASGSSSTVTVTTLLSTSSKQPEKLSATDSTVIIGGSIAGVVVVLTLTVCVCFIIMRRRARQPKHFNSKSMLFLNVNQPPFTMVSQEKEQVTAINTTPFPRRRDQTNSPTIPSGARLSKYNYLSEAFSQMRSTGIDYSKPSLTQHNTQYNTNNIMDNNNSNNNSNNNNNIPSLSPSSTAVKLPKRDPTIDAYFKKNFDVAPPSHPPVSHPSASHLSIANSSISDVSKYSAIIRPYMQQSSQATYNSKYI